MADAGSPSGGGSAGVALFGGDVLDAVQDPLVVLGADWRVTWANRALERYSGFSRDLMIGRDLWETLPHLGQTRVGLELLGAMRDRTPATFEIAAPFRPGDVLMVSLQPAGDGLACSFRNVTSALRTETAAQARLAELETIYDSVPIGLALLDRDLRYLRVNRALAELDGVAAEDHIGRTAREVIPNVADAMEAVFRQVLDAGVAIKDFEISGETAAAPGVGRTWLGSAAPVRGPDGAVQQIQVTAVEITERKAAEARLAAALDAQLESQRQRARLLSEMNHRVKNNFQMVASLLDLQARRSDDPRLREQLASAMRRVRVLADLHTSLAPDPNVEEIEFGGYLAGLCDKLRASIEDSARVLLRHTGGSARLRAQVAVPLGFVVNELVTNAIKYAFPAGASGEITVGFAPSGEGFELVVADNGRGLPPDAEARGAGLGMRLVRAFTAQAGGEMEIRDAGPGTAYVIRLAPPVDQADEALF